MDRRLAMAATVLLWLAGGLAAETKTLADFESRDDLKRFEFKKGSARIVSEHATHGKKALAVRNGEYLVSWREPVVGDWTGYDVLRFDYFNATGAPVKLYVLIGDEAWRATKGGTYWNRFNGGGVLREGAGTFTLPIEGLYRGEAGSRNNDLKDDIDLRAVVRVDFGLKGKDGEVFLDHLRLESASVPDFVRAFDFGPASQPRQPGFTVVSWDTIYGKARGFGFDARRRPWSSSRARDDTFPAPLLRDFVEARDCTFLVSLPDGLYRVWLVFDDLGYWGGEQTRHRARSIDAGGVTVYRENRARGWAHALYDFEDVEPLPGVDLWKTYLEKLFRPVEFEAQVAGGKLAVSFRADAPWSSKVAGMIVYPAARAAAGRRFTDAVWEEQRQAFLARAVELGAERARPDPAPAGRHPIVFHVGKDEPVTPRTVPAPNRRVTRFQVSAARGEHEPLVFGIRAARDMTAVEVSLKGLVKAGGAAIPAQNITPQVAWYLARRGFNSVAYRFATHTLRPARGFAVPVGVAREVWVDLNVPEDAAPGEYSGPLVISWRDGAARRTLTLPVTLSVLPFRMHDTPFHMGFYGIEPPRHLPEEQRNRWQRKIFSILRDYGMNTFSGGPDVVVEGFRSGEPVLDFAAMDEFMRLARSFGFDRPYLNYGGGGIRGLYSRYRYVIGDTGRKLAREAGLPYGEAAQKVLDAYREHAEAENYLPLILGLVDETRVVEQAREQLKLQQALRRAAPWLATSGSYSVTFSHPPRDELEGLLQEFFSTLRVNVVNRHDRSVLDMARKLGSPLWIYNQGQSRYTFGFYQWAEYAKGVAGRMQWHLFILHGWQYFDLDGREPDTGVLAYHSRLGILPTLNLARIREGVEDMLYCQTLHDLVKARPDHPAAAGAKALLERIETGIAVNQTRKPAWLDQDAVRAELARFIVALSGR